jgi:hypothetical protein
MKIAASLAKGILLILAASQGFIVIFYLLSLIGGPLAIVIMLALFLSLIYFSNLKMRFCNPVRDTNRRCCVSPSFGCVAGELETKA